MHIIPVAFSKPAEQVSATGLAIANMTLLTHGPNRSLSAAGPLHLAYASGGLTDNELPGGCVPVLDKRDKHLGRIACTGLAKETEALFRATVRPLQYFACYVGPVIVACRVWV